MSDLKETNPKGWVFAKLGDVLDIQGGSQPPKLEFVYEPQKGFIQLLQIRDFGLKPVPTYVPQSRVTKFCKKEDVLIARYGASLGRIVTGLEGAYNVALAKVIDTHELFSKKYLFYLLKTSVLQMPLKLISRSAQNGFAKHEIAHIELPLPPLAEQHRIVAKIEELFSELDKGNENLKIARAQLKVYRQALLKHAFEGKLTAQWREQNKDELETASALQQRIQAERATRCQQQLANWQATGQKGSKPKVRKSLPLTDAELAKLPLLPEGWGWFNLGSFIDSIDAGKSFKCDEREPMADEIGVAKVSAVTWGKYDETESKTCTDLSKINQNYFIQSGDFILSRANTIDLVGACVIAKNVTKKIMLSDKTLRIKFGGFSEKYFLQYLLGRNGRKQIMQLSTGNQESMRNIGQDRIRSIVVPICSKAEADVVLENIASKLSEAEQLDQTITTALQQSEALRQSILKKAFTGTLAAQDTNDEPASALLARIKAEKALQSVTPKPRKIQKVRVLPEPTKTNVIPFPVKISNISATDLHAGIIARAYQLHESSRRLDYYGHVKAEKISHLVECHLGIDLERVPFKDAAGPNDYPHLKKVESRARKAGWFDVRQAQKDGPYVLTRLRGFDGLVDKTANILSDRLSEVDALLKLLLPMNTRQAEIVATLYAGWNNLLLLGQTPSDDEIVYESRENWHTDKLNIERDKFFKALVWMREHGLVPTGKGRYVNNKESSGK